MSVGVFLVIDDVITIETGCTGIFYLTFVRLL